MIYENFVTKALEFDNRNKFGKGEIKYFNIPEDLKEFYNNYNPLDVEVLYKGMPLKFFPLNEIDSIKTEYNLPNDTFIFASINGDPVFLLDNKIYRSLADIYKPEFLSESFVQFIENL